MSARVKSFSPLNTARGVGDGLSRPKVMAEMAQSRAHRLVREALVNVATT